MPAGENGWQDWTAEGYAETDEWQRYIEEQLAIAEEMQQRRGGMPGASDLARNRISALEDLRTSGPSAIQLSGINREARTSWENSPQRALEEYGELGGAPEMAPPSMETLRRYQLGAMDVPARTAALQSGAASQRLGGLNPAARSQALSEISRGGSGMVGGGGGWSGMPQQAALASYQGQMQNRGMLGNAIQQSLGQGYAMDRMGLQHRNAQEMMRMQYDMQKRQQRGNSFWNAMGSVVGTAFGGPVGSAVGNWFGGKFGGGGRGQYDYSSPMGGQQYQYAPPGYGR